MQQAKGNNSMKMIMAVISQGMNQEWPGLYQESTRNEPGMNQEWTRNEPGMNQEWTTLWPGMNQEWTRNGPGMDHIVTRNDQEWKKLHSWFKSTFSQIDRNLVGVYQESARNHQTPSSPGRNLPGVWRIPGSPGRNLPGIPGIRGPV